MAHGESHAIRVVIINLPNISITNDNLTSSPLQEYGPGWEESGNSWGENGIGEEPYEEVNVVEHGRRSRLRLSSLRADCDDYMVVHIDYILLCVNNIFDCKKGIEAERTALRMATIYSRIHGPENKNSKRAKA